MTAHLPPRSRPAPAGLYSAWCVCTGRWLQEEEERGRGLEEGSSMSLTMKRKTTFKKQKKKRRRRREAGAVAPLDDLFWKRGLSCVNSH